MKARSGLRLRKLGKDREELVGIPSIGGDDPVRPEVRGLTLSKLRQGSFGDAQDALDQRRAQHLGDSPELADRQRVDGLIGIDESEDVLPVQAQIRMEDEFPREPINARETPVRLAGERRKLPVIASGKVHQRFAGIAVDDVLVVEEPLGRWRRALSQSTRFGKIQACHMDPRPSPFEPFEQFAIPPGMRVHPLVPGETLGMLLNLRRRERIREALRLFDETLSPRMHDEYRGRDLAACPQRRRGGTHRFDRRPENQDGLFGYEPSRVIIEQPSFHAVPRSSHPRGAEEDPGDSTQKARGQGGGESARNRPRPTKDHGNSCGERSEQNKSHGGSDGAAPQEGVLCMDISTRGLAHERDAAKPTPLKLPECPASLSSLREVAYEDTCFQSLSLHRHWVHVSRHCDGFH